MKSPNRATIRISTAAIVMAENEPKLNGKKNASKLKMIEKSSFVVINRTLYGFIWGESPSTIQ